MNNFKMPGLFRNVQQQMENVMLQQGQITAYKSLTVLLLWRHKCQSKTAVYCASLQSGLETVFIVYTWMLQVETFSAYVLNKDTRTLQAGRHSRHIAPVRTYWQFTFGTVRCSCEQTQRKIFLVANYIIYSNGPAQQITW